MARKNSRPDHPTTRGKAERFRQTLENRLRSRPDQPVTLTDLQGLLDRFRTECNQHRPHRSLPHRATPATVYRDMLKALPGPSRDTDTHDRVRHERVSSSGTVTLRVAGALRHIGIGRTHVILSTQDQQVRVVDATTGELLRELTIDPTRDYRPRA